MLVISHRSKAQHNLFRMDPQNPLQSPENRPRCKFHYRAEKPHLKKLSSQSWGGALGFGGEQNGCLLRYVGPLWDIMVALWFFFRPLELRRVIGHPLSAALLWGQHPGNRHRRRHPACGTSYLRPLVQRL
eukprot:6479864-Amphidinium_carterae.2